MQIEQLVGLDEKWEKGTNLHHALLLANRHFRKHPNAQPVLLIVTDGEPTSHLESDGEVFFDYPPNPMTIALAVRELDGSARLGARTTFFRLGDDPGLARFVDAMAKRAGGTVVTPETRRPGRRGHRVLPELAPQRRLRRVGSRRGVVRAQKNGHGNAGMSPDGPGKVPFRSSRSQRAASAATSSLAEQLGQALTEVAVQARAHPFDARDLGGVQRLAPPAPQDRPQLVLDVEADAVVDAVAVAVGPSGGCGRPCGRRCSRRRRRRPSGAARGSPRGSGSAAGRRRRCPGRPRASRPAARRAPGRRRPGPARRRAPARAAPCPDPADRRAGR